MCQVREAELTIRKGTLLLETLKKDQVANNNILAFQVDTLRKKMLALDEKRAVPRASLRSGWFGASGRHQSTRKRQRTELRNKRRQTQSTQNPAQEMQRFQVAKSNMATLTLCRGKDIESAFQQYKCRGMLSVCAGDCRADD